MKKRGCLPIVGAFIVLGIIGSIASTSNKNTSSVSDTAETTAASFDTGFSSIADFSYDISDDTLILKKYSGSSDTVYIGSNYQIDGVEHSFSKIDGSSIFGHSVKNILFADGITEISHTLFNSSSVEKLYIPASMAYIYDDTLAYASHSLTDIYYGGSEEQWNSIYTAYKPNDVKDEIENKDYKGAGVAAGDKLNQLMGHNFDPSAVNFHYNATPDELLNSD